jgi:hypothetical protein
VARKVVQLAIFLLAVHALYRFVPIYLHYQQFKDAVHEAALFSRGKTDEQLVDQVMELAQEHRVPLSREYVQVRRENERTSISASYVETIEWLPGYRRQWQFDVGEGLFANVRPGALIEVGR